MEQRTGLRRSYGRYRDLFRGRPMPFAFVDLELLDANSAAVLRRAGDRPVRIATKSVRCEAMVRRILDTDPRFRGLMCFAAPEAVHLAGRGFDDLLIAYPTVEPAHLEAVARAVAGGARITLTVDCDEHLDAIEATTAAAGTRLPVSIEIDMSLDVPGLRFGVWRSPIRTAAAATRLARRIAASDRLVLDGIMGYEAQVAGLPDRAPGQALRNPVIRALKRWSVRMVRERRAEIVRAVEAATGPLRFVNGGGTGSLESTTSEDVVTEAAAGSAFFAPGLFDHYDAFHHLPAAGFAIPVVRRPAPDVYTCLGGGYIASGATGPSKQPVPYLPAGARLLPNEGAGEVQTPIRYRGPERVAIGDPIFLRHAKAGELCERFDRLLLVTGGGVAGEAPTYRGEGLTFP